MIPMEAVVVMQQLYDMYLLNMEKSTDGASRSHWATKADAIDDLVLELKDRGLME